MKAPVAHDGYGKVAKGLLRWAMVPAIVALLCLLPNFLMFWGDRDQKSDRARLDLRNIRQALNAYRERTGVWLPEQRWAEALIDSQMLGREPLDPWDRPYRYQFEILDAGERRPVLTSLGRDGELGTDDDISSNEAALKQR